MVGTDFRPDTTNRNPLVIMIPQSASAMTITTQSGGRFNSMLGIITDVIATE